MAAGKNDKVLLKKVQKQVRSLKRKEVQTRHQLRIALQKIRKLGEGYKSKLASKVRSMQSKLTQAQASTYAKAAADIERRMVKGIQAKGKSLISVLGKLEKKHISTVLKELVQKGKKVGTRKKARRSMKRSRTSSRH